MEFFLSPNPTIILVLKIVFGSISLFLIISIIYFIVKSNYLITVYLRDVTEVLSYKPYGTRKIVKQWNKIKSRLDLSSEAEHKLAVIEADNLLNETLERMGYDGDTVGEKLKQITSIRLPNIDQILEAHKIRNNIVYDPDYQLSLDQGQRALEIYEKTLQELQVL
ncbi:MAG TPA: hypothetical protein ENI19_03440 [Candidatus Nealsonbacteria bacterium]|uniref:DUF4145 domain-containing protein n=1 Tax=marine sediment metagenome TaxID=412755 RepID=A0A0F9YEM6_9ZZZZ|nr:hypothetical protein [Candidatus Nealsonbacteria bacterium]HEB46734.1 hypothetical protein [Candidatus Nealsonbacteria bacterium]